MRKEIIASAILAILVTSIASITVLADVPTQANAVKQVSYVDSKWETVGSTTVTEIDPAPAGVTVRKCAIVCDPNNDLTSTTVKAHVFKIDGTTKELETLHEATGGEVSECGTPSLYTGCGLYTGTFTMTTSDPEGLYTVAVWTEGQGQVSAIIKGANRLVDNQNTDGGWCWPNGVNPCTSTTNTNGVTAMGLYYAYKLTENQSYMDAMEDAVLYIQSTPPTYNVCDETVKGSDSNKDILFLAKLALLTNNDVYANLAKARWENIKTNCGVAAYAQKVINSRKTDYAGLIGWDLGDWVLALYKLSEYPGMTDYRGDAGIIANALSDAIDNNDFVITDSNEPYYYLGLAGVIEAFETTGTHSTKLATAIANLKAGQNSDGSWPYNGEDPAPDVQSTAYAKMALDMAGGQENMVLAAAGATWLIANQTTDGYWDDGYGEYDEVTSEGIWAIATDISKQNRFKYNPYIGLEIDASVINFGSIQAGVPKSVLGDDNFATTSKPTVKNVGNVVIDAQIYGTDMTGPSQTIPVGNIEDQFNTHGWYALSLSTGRVESNLDLAPGATESLDFKLTPPIPLATGLYTGTVTIIAVAD
jgi:hypothetical protein